jgi:AraC-like DNA-binding protein
MYILPGSQHASGMRTQLPIPDRLQRLLLEGFDAVYSEGNHYYQLCQHYDHPEFDLYHYHIYSQTSTQLFSKAENSRWVLGYLPMGATKQLYYQDHLFDLAQHSVLFFPTRAGKEIRIDIQAGYHTIVCCCFKVGFDPIIQTFFSPILDPPIQYPILIHSIGFHFQYEWELLLLNKKQPEIRLGFYSGQIRILLGLVCEMYFNQRREDDLWQNHPDIDPLIVQKAYQVKRIIESRLGDSLSLSDLVKGSGWNLQGLKSGFLKVFGLTPHQYVIQYRMKIAYELIQKSEDLNIQAISITCGYKQSHHFIKQFKSFYGKTPGDVRKSLS